MTVADQPALHSRVAAYHRLLAPFPALEPILPQWLHLTVQGVRFLDELRPEVAGQLTRLLDQAFGATTPFEVRVEHPVVSSDSVLMPVRPIGPLAALRDRIRELLGSLPGCDELFVLPGQHEAFDPHISIAYAGGPVPRADVERTLAGYAGEPVPMTISHFSVMTLNRSQRKYHWQDEHFVRFSA